MNFTSLNKVNSSFLLASLLLLLATGFLAAIHFYEWFSVAILKEFKGYPFRSEGPVPYYYKTPELYAFINFVWAIIFTAEFSAALISTFKKSLISLVVTFGFTFLAFSCMLIQGWTE